MARNCRYGGFERVCELEKYSSGYYGLILEAQGKLDAEKTRAVQSLLNSGAGGLMLNAAIFISFLAGVAVQWKRNEFSVSPTIFVVVSLAYGAVYLYFLMTPVTMLSVAYREIIGLPEGAAPESARPA